MPAFVEHRFPRGFLLDEEKLRRIHDIILTRVSKYEKPPLPRYKVYRGDSYSYETGSLDDIAREDNEDWRSLARVEALISEKEILDFKLAFSGDGVTLEMTGSDRDAVFLLFSDLREYIQNEVAIARRPPSRNTNFAVMMVLLALLTMGFFYDMSAHRFGVDQDARNRVLAASDIVQKLNFLIGGGREMGELGRRLVWWFVSLFLLTGLGWMGAFERLPKALFPSNVFLFGKRKSSFERRQRLLSNIFWIVVVGLAVSLIAGYFVWRFTRS